MFRDQVREARKSIPKKPVMIAEFGSAEQGGDKAEWIKDIPADLKISMTQVKAIVLFDLKKECDWRATSCLNTEDAYKAILKDPYFLTSTAGLNEISTETVSAEKSVAIAKKTAVPIVIDGDFAPFSKSVPIIMDRTRS